MELGISEGSQPTYEGLKRGMPLTGINLKSAGSQPTYEGLKHTGIGIWYKDNAQFPAYL